MPNGNMNGNLNGHGHLSGVLTIGLGGTSNYNELENRPSVNNIILEGNKTSHDLGLASMQDVSDIASDIALLSQRLPKNYSTTEQNTGIKWIDGKYIYQKTYVINLTGTNVTVPTGISGENIISLNGFFRRSGGNETLVSGVMYYDGSDWLNIQYYNGIRIYCTNWFVGASGAVTIFYTKDE